eukprot:TRINITY_DN20321_c0_g1_i1.p1 TRINITY_DN20321_c0_g1~~TRINITY_DN20321_c0_g1_i1.p1  ORF type:complete len:235 (+),score=142.08 TRINITY_DN20321_c0_g1_i1:66-770(+)
MSPALKLAATVLLLLALLQPVEGARRKKNIKKQQEEEAKRQREFLRKQTESGKTKIDAKPQGFRIEETEPRKQQEERSRPYDCPNDLYCKGCKAALAAMEKTEKQALKHAKRMTQAAIMSEALENVCDVKNMDGFGDTPVKVRIGCMSYIADHEDDLEAVFIDKNRSPGNRYLHFCEAISRACLDIPKKEEKKKKESALKDADFEIKEYPDEPRSVDNIDVDQIIADALSDTDL